MKKKLAPPELPARMMSMKTGTSSVTGEGNAPRYKVKRMLEPEGTRFGVYRGGKLWEAGYVTETAAQKMADLMNRLMNRFIKPKTVFTDGTDAERPLTAENPAHTPGPWFVNGPWHIQARSEKGDGNLRIVAQLVDWSANVETLEANARLIAAAPELLAALKALHDDIAEYARINNLGGFDNYCMKRARAAIAAATLD